MEAAAGQTLLTRPPSFRLKYSREFLTTTGEPATDTRPWHVGLQFIASRQLLLRRDC
jgi:hypothetical protein